MIGMACPHCEYIRNPKLFEKRPLMMDIFPNDPVLTLPQKEPAAPGTLEEKIEMLSALKMEGFPIYTM